MDPTLFIPTGMEWIIILVLIVILIFGAKKIPELARSLGRATGEFKKGRAEAEKEIELLQKGTEVREVAEREKLKRAAEELGISVEGKSDEELREEIKKALG